MRWRIVVWRWSIHRGWVHHVVGVSVWNPIIGGWIDSNRATAAASGLTDNALELATGQATITTMIAFPGILIILFTILYFWMKGRTPASAMAH